MNSTALQSFKSIVSNSLKMTIDRNSQTSTDIFRRNLEYRIETLQNDKVHYYEGQCCLGFAQV